MVNKVILLGNVGNEPDIKMMPSGGKVANLSLATSENWRDKDGNKQAKTEHDTNPNKLIPLNCDKCGHEMLIDVNDLSRYKRLADKTR